MSGGKIIIGNLFDESKINNTSYAKAWYIRCKNDEGIVGTRITQEEFNHIKEQYSQNIPQWDALAERDTTEYDIDLYDEAKEKGGNAIEKYANDKAYEGKSDEEIKKDQNKNKATNISSTVMGVGSVATAGAAAGTVIRTFVRGGAAATNTVKAAQYLWQVGCTMSFAIGLLYECTHPNKNVDAAIKAMDEFLSGTAYNNVDTANTEMLNQANIVTNLGTAAADGQVRVQSELDKKQEEYEKKQEQLEKAQLIYDGIADRIASGEEVSPSEKQQLEACKNQIATLGAEVQRLSQEVADLTTEFNEVKEENAEATEAAQEELDAKGEALAEVKGETEKAANADKDAKTQERMQIATHSMNIVSGTASLISGAFEIAREAVAGPIGWIKAALDAVFLGLGASGVGMSIHAVAEQSKYLKNTNNEIKTRENTENFLNEAVNTHSNVSGLKDTILEDVNELEIDDYDLDDIDIPDMPDTPNTPDVPKTPDTPNTQPQVNLQAENDDQQTSPEDSSQQEKKPEENKNPFI